MNQRHDTPSYSVELSAEAIRSLPTVGAVMGRDVLTVTDDMPRDTALRRLVQHRLPSVPVVRGGTPVGVVSVCDLAGTGAASRSDDGYPLYYLCEDQVLRSWLERGLVAQPGQVREVMHPFVLSIEVSANLVQAAHRMLSENVRRLLVRDGTRLVGVVTSFDLLAGLARWFAPEVTLGAHAAGGIGPGSEERTLAGPEDP